MTKLLQKALEAVQRLPADSQDEIARAMLQLAEPDAEPEPIDPTHLSDVLESLAQAKRRQFAADSEVEAAFRRFDRRGDRRDRDPQRQAPLARARIP
jgi:hypothetical protein